MIKLIISLIFITSTVFALEQKSTIEVKTNSIKKALSNFNFNYFTKYSGAALGGNYSQGATFNRFDGGVQDGQDFDATGSYQLYQSFRLGYRFSNNWNLAYGVTFQENLSSDVEYKNIYGNTNTRSNGKSYNNHRVSLFVPGILNTSIGVMSTSYFYEMPNQGSRNSGMKYGLGFQPTFRFYSNVPTISFGINSSFERYFYDDSAFNPQGVMLSLGPYLNYRINDRFTLKNGLNFDWDQKGDQVGTTTLGRNMHNVGLVGVGARVVKRVFVDVFVGYSISEMSLANTSMGASLDISI